MIFVINVKEDLIIYTKLAIYETKKLSNLLVNNTLHLIFYTLNMFRKISRITSNEGKRM